jgi:hypothetical protein
MGEVSLFGNRVTGSDKIQVIPTLPIKSKVRIGNVRAFVLADQVVNGTGWIVEGMSGRLGSKKPSKGTDQANKNKDGNRFRLHFIFLFYFLNLSLLRNVLALRLPFFRVRKGIALVLDDLHSLRV